MSDHGDGTNGELNDGAVETPIDLNYERARLAYSIIETLLAHVDSTQDLVALMAQALDEDTKSALTNTPQWQAYLESRRAMRAAEPKMEQFAEMMQDLAANDGDAV